MLPLILVLTSWVAAPAIAQYVPLEEQAGQPACLFAKEDRLERLRTALQANPRDADALLLLGMIREPGARENAPEAELVLQMYQTAVSVLEERRAERASDLALALELSARLQLRLGKTEDAQKSLDNALAIRRRIVQALSPPAATADGAEVQPERLRKGIKPPLLKTRKEPDYSNLARMAQVQGAAVIEAVIGADGQPGSFRLVRSLGFGLDERAAAALKQWRFEPPERDGRPSPVLIAFEFIFRLL